MKPLLVEVLTAFNDVTLREAYLDGGHTHWIHGEHKDETVTINPMPHVVDTLIHELLHHVRPDWSETQVRRHTTLLMRQLSHGEVQQIYKEYQARKD